MSQCVWSQDEITSLKQALLKLSGTSEIYYLIKYMTKSNDFGYNYTLVFLTEVSFERSPNQLGYLVLLF